LGRPSHSALAAHDAAGHALRAVTARERGQHARCGELADASPAANTR
jgi:hypothetical protein